MDPRQRIQGFVFNNNVVAAWNNGAGTAVNLADPCYAMNNIHMAQAFDAGACALVGSAGADTITGGGGNNQLWGAGGDDLLIGGAGSNAFWGGQGDGHDRITEAGVNAHDALYLYNVDWNSFRRHPPGRRPAIFPDRWFHNGPDQLVQPWTLANGSRALSLTTVPWPPGTTAQAPQLTLADPCYANEQHP